MTKSSVNESKDPSKFVHKVDLTQPDYLPWKDRKRPPGSQAGRYKRFDKSIPNGAERVLEPKLNDVVFGRGKGSHDHPGNKRMREIIRRHKKDYAEIHRSKKRRIAELVYTEITQAGARFLHKEKDEEDYAVVDLNLALQKLSNTLRCRKSCLIGEDDEDGAPGDSPSGTSSPAGSISIGAAAAASIQALRHPLTAIPPALMPPVGGLTSAASSLRQVADAIAAIAATDPLLRGRLLGGLTRPLLSPASIAERELLMAPPSLAERELLLRSRSAIAPLGGSFLGSSLLSSEPLLSSAPLLPRERFNEMVLAEQEYILARKRLWSAALGL
mmetsp:Transcript_35707/g.86405  ORF Transcript_35707/g.86405 Transcript_35707/m.86405 type:complete len:329 (-) Transcript_35707:130-1116(-)|eukprot:CAMPEP_0113618952 /NCGR_PEP_ID=MMETSP0017_2-20120614/9615_1 /TAXON_ID=2856 /ORGANISM="Cylindrotheca closterium" /LENGTH=328 /DNA_ID=CAMNT_0000528503 /DNA_START=75 /DNA_END=1061 /DNA_ORIENTATION=+ /assembly_acc=CAM_ASM_000147